MTIDRAEPKAPLFSGVPGGGITRENVTLQIDGHGERVLYRLGEERRFTTLDVENAVEYTAPIVIKGTSNEEIRYSITAIAIDEAGNMSDPSYAYFTVDKISPGTPEAPSVYVSDRADGRVSIGWKSDSDHRIYYRITPNENESFSLYREPISVMHSPGNGSVVIRRETRAM